MSIKQIVGRHQSKKVISTADARRCTQIYRAASKAVGKALNLEAGFAEVEQQTEPQAGHREVVDALGGASAVQRLDRFQFDDDCSFDKQIDCVLPDDQSKKVISTADARRWTQIYRAASKTVGKTLDLEAGLAEVEQQTEPQAGHREVVDALGGVSAVQRLNRFQFDDDSLLDQQIDRVLPDDNAVVVNLNPVLLRDSKTGLAELVGQCVLVNLLEKSGSERINDLECATDNLLRQSIGPDFICVHLRASAVEIPYGAACDSGLAGSRPIPRARG